jgi:hypothetical protein
MSNINSISNQPIASLKAQIHATLAKESKRSKSEGSNKTLQTAPPFAKPKTIDFVGYSRQML